MRGLCAGKGSSWGGKTGSGAAGKGSGLSIGAGTAAVCLSYLYGGPGLGSAMAGGVESKLGLRGLITIGSTSAPLRKYWYCASTVSLISSRVALACCISAYKSSNLRFAVTSWSYIVPISLITVPTSPLMALS